ncbi:nucleotidyltransferase family protein [Asticcacaulis sp. ZE23SCel15]|uniref:nucleotidyltransferase family protein n=1 Tax=Asticcacaulis sp. ZE23SCel15 TaxID=3059027 RepID=UPI00265E13FE|nr:nucleotidyltransferase family protein [Asticcacaulis sp. ZE23SCel15]WKL58374.1 nucleotidyltransferase family protein [Asticcacaulis sp. ZE23SCel15]
MTLAAIILAAGASHRFGPEDKLQARLADHTVLDTAIAATFGLGQRLLITRAPTPVPEGVQVVINPDADAGMGGSLALGMASLAPCDGVFVVLGDMPLIPQALYQQLADHLTGHDIVVPTHDGRDGHPVLFAANCFDDLRALSGDKGARGLITSGRYRVTRCEVATDAIVQDIDTKDDLTALTNRSKTAP